MLDKALRDEIIEIAKGTDFSAAALLAVCEVESGGKVFAKVNGRNEPLIRFEGHYFYRLLGAAKRNQAVVQGLASRKAGGVKNPRSQTGRWRLLAKASAIERGAALESCSWGMGQVMGAHWRWLDFASIDAMVDKARSGVCGQLELMLRFIDKSGLNERIRELDWRGFARGYNGPQYAKNHYDTKLANAYERYSALLGEKSLVSNFGRNAPLLVRYGDRGVLVRDLQTKLQAFEYGLVVDGDFGPLTLSALCRFQRDSGLIVDGIAGPQTFLALERTKIA